MQHDLAYWFFLRRGCFLTKARRAGFLQRSKPIYCGVGGPAGQCSRFVAPLAKTRTVSFTEFVAITYGDHPSYRHEARRPIQSNVIRVSLSRLHRSFPPVVLTMRLLCQDIKSTTGVCDGFFIDGRLRCRQEQPRVRSVLASVCGRTNYSGEPIVVKFTRQAVCGIRRRKVQVVENFAWLGQISTRVIQFFNCHNIAIVRIVTADSRKQLYFHLRLSPEKQIGPVHNLQ